MNSRFVVLASLLSRARFYSSSTSALERPTGIVVDLLSRAEGPQTTAQLWETAQVKKEKKLVTFFVVSIDLRPPSTSTLLSFLSNTPRLRHRRQPI